MILIRLVTHAFATHLSRYARCTKRFTVFAALLGVSCSALAHFDDSFTRSDNAALGNGWIEKNPAAFTLDANRAVKQAVSAEYRDNLVYRPSAEDVLNVEVAAELQLTSLPPGYPQVFVRVQSATAATANTIDGYMLYVNDSATEAVLGRQSGTAFVTTLATLSLTPALNTSDRFRLRLRAQGTNPVQLAAYVERLSASGAWVVIGQALASDSSSQRIQTAGSVGFSGFIEGNYSLDNFTRVDLGAIGTSNPAPTTASLAPSMASAGESELLLIVYGSGFTTDSIVRWNGSNRSTTYVSPSELEATITGNDLASVGSANVTVFNPTPGGGTAGALTFTISDPSGSPPSIGALSPSTATAGDTAFTLTVTGNGFNSMSVVRWNGSPRTTTFVSSTQVTAQITAADIASAGSANVTVFRSSDSQSSSAAIFTVDSTPGPGFTDSFARADGDGVGNGWIEKTPAAFALAGGQAAKVGAGNDYRNNVVYRPSSEDIADVETSIEIRFLTLPTGYPQLLNRIQSATVGPNGQLDAYLLFIPDNASQATIARQRGTDFYVPLTTFDLSSALNTTDTFRLRMSTVGSNPVQINGYVERLSGGSWTVIGQGSFSDTANDRIASSGSVGFSGFIETNYTYDNFSRSAASAPSPAPALTFITPNSRLAGSGAFTLTVDGTGFVPSSTVRWNGVDRTTTFVSATQLTAAITAADVATAGSASITVFNPSPGGGTSGTLGFTITPIGGSNPVPQVTSLSPSSVAAGSGALTLTVNGSNFVSGSTVRWNGSNRTTTFVSPTQLTAAISEADVASQGSRTVTVFTPSPGGGTSSNLTFTVGAPNNPTPTVTSLSPSSGIAGSGAFTLSVNGSNFVIGATVRWNGANRATTFVSATQLTAAITAVDVQNSGSASVTVFNPTPGGGVSSAVNFAILPSGGSGAPNLISLTPMIANVGAGSTVVTISGTGFTPSSVVRWNGATRPTAYQSANQLQVTLPASDFATDAIGTITVADGALRSTPLSFFVLPAGESAYFDGFNRGPNPDIGNGWTEKYPAAFSIASDGTISAGDTAPFDFHDAIIYRPLGEDFRDVETGVEFIRRPGGVQFPQLHARVQRDTITQADTLESYILYVEDFVPSPGALAIAVQAPITDLGECVLSLIPLPSELVVGDRYRMRFQVQGSYPVVLTAILERFNGSTWELFTYGSLQHDNDTEDAGFFCPYTSVPVAIQDQGTLGLAKWTTPSATYDNFYWRTFGGGSSSSNVPAISSIAPNSMPAGSGSFTLFVRGTNFNANSTIRWNGVDQATTFVSATELRATIPGSEIAAVGEDSVSVFTYGNNGGSSPQMLTFTTVPSVPMELVFTDSFSRADSATIGNGWIAKVNGIFALQNGRVVKGPSVTDYRDTILYRPAPEAQTASEAQVVLRLSSLAVGYPALFNRLQPATAAEPDSLDAYMMFFDDSTSQVIVGRQRGSGFVTTLTSFTLTTPLNTTDQFRMRLRTTGTSPVEVQGMVERLVGGVWTVVGQASALDSNPQRITDPGVGGLGAWNETSYSFDDFTFYNLPGQ